MINFGDECFDHHLDTYDDVFTCECEQCGMHFESWDDDDMYCDECEE